jgi:glycosyltransferase involved in cell wall biosynthesis
MKSLIKMPKTKVTYIISGIDWSIGFEWIVENLNKDKIELSFVLLNPGDSYIENYLKEKGVLTKKILYRGKKDYVSALIKTYLFLIKQRPDIIHVHLFEAGMIGIVAGKLAGIHRRIYTRHYSTYHHVYAPHAVKYDKLINKLSTDIVSISENVTQILISEGVDKNKICKVPHGFNINYFRNPDVNIIRQLKEKYKTEGKYPVIGVISRYTEWKGIQYTIPAFKKLLETYPEAKLVLANARGDYAPNIRKLLSGLPYNAYVEIDFEYQLAELYQLFDIFVHVPIDHHSEAFGQIYVEALAAGIPSIFTMSGIAHEFIKDKENAIVVPYKDSDAIYEAIMEIIKNNELRNRIKENGRIIVEQFSLDRLMKNLENLYLQSKV